MITLDKKTTRDLIENSKSFMNWNDVFYTRNHETRELENLNKMGSITSWHNCLYPEWKGGYPNTKITRDRLTKALGSKPVCQYTTWCKNNVWGFEHDGAKFLVFDSVRGTSFCADVNVTNRQIKSIIDCLFKLLCNEKNIYEMYVLSRQGDEKKLENEDGQV